MKFTLHGTQDNIVNNGSCLECRMPLFWVWAWKDNSRRVFGVVMYSTLEVALKCIG